MKAETPAWMTGSATSRANTSTAVARVMAATIPPSQKASRFSTGRRRVTKTKARPARMGSVAITSPIYKTAAHIAENVTLPRCISWRYWRIRSVPPVTGVTYPLLSHLAPLRRT